eukprot:782046-Rhodomonas_salina.1
MQGYTLPVFLSSSTYMSTLDRTTRNQLRLPRNRASHGHSTRVDSTRCCPGRRFPRTQGARYRDPSTEPGYPGTGCNTGYPPAGTGATPSGPGYPGTPGYLGATVLPAGTRKGSRSVFHYDS